MTNPSSSAASSKRQPRFIYLLNVAQKRVQTAIQGSGDGKTAARAGLLLALPVKEAAEGSPEDTALPMAQLGAALDMGPSTLSGLVDRMERDGLIQRQHDPSDGRAWHIALTAQGKAARQDALDAARHLNTQLCEGFTEAEQAIVVRWLESVRTKFPTKMMKEAKS